MDERQWYYVKEGQQCGPVSEARLIELLRDGSIGASTQVWTQGMENWREASAVEGLVAGTPQPLQAAPATVPQSFHPQRPTAVTVFGILNIVFGTLGLLCMPVGLIAMFAMPQVAHQAATPRAWLLLSSAIGLACTIFLIVIGTGLLYLKAWARKGSLVYGWFAIIWGIIGACINVGFMVSRVGGNAETVVPSMIGGVCGGLIGLIYPVLLVIFMQRPNVKEACTR